MKYKYDLFISYSSNDKEIVTRLSDELKRQKYQIWLDEWEIQVGEQIIQKISDGLESSRYLGIWLSKSSVLSKWVEREWQTKYWDEVNSNTTVVLPMLAENCDIPLLLKGKKYANFIHSFDAGLKELQQVLQKNSSILIEYYLDGLIEDKESDECAKRLGDIVLRSEDEIAMESIWKGTLSTKYPEIVVDHCSFTVGRIIKETTNPKIVERGFEILNDSLYESEIIIDKYAYTTGEIALHATQANVRQKALEFIIKNSSSTNEFVKDRYVYTQKRVQNISKKHGV